MRVSVIRGEHQVELRTLGWGRRRLHEAEQVALRLLGDPDGTESSPPFGFALDADTELADDPQDSPHPGALA
jgi:hypothetical protein